MSLWQLPYIAKGSTLFDDPTAVDGFVRTTDGDLHDVGLCDTPGFAGRVGCIDFTNPEAVRVYPSHLRRLLDLGARAITADFGEQAPLDGVHHERGADVPPFHPARIRSREHARSDERARETGSRSMRVPRAPRG